MACKRYLIDGIEVALWRFLGIFPCEMKDIIFTWRRGWEMDVRWGCSCKVKIPTQGENGHVRWLQGGNGHARWEWSHEVGMVMWDGNGHTRWEWSCKVGMVTQGDFLGVVEGTSSELHKRWEWTCKVGMVTWGGCGVGMDMGGGDGHIRWLFRGGREDSIRHAHKVGMFTWGQNGHVSWTGGENGHVRWEWSHEVTFQWWSREIMSHLVKFFTPWYYLTLFGNVMLFPMLETLLKLTQFFEFVCRWISLACEHTLIRYCLWTYDQWALRPTEPTRPFSRPVIMDELPVCKINLVPAG